MRSENKFPEHLLLNDPNRGRRLVYEFYQLWGETKQNPAYYVTIGPQHEQIKSAFYQDWLKLNGLQPQNLGVDLGCRGGVLTEMVGIIRWVGVDIDPGAVQAALERIPCAEMDFTVGIGFQDESFDAVMMTEVLEHLPYPSITFREAHRILKKKPGS